MVTVSGWYRKLHAGIYTLYTRIYKYYECDSRQILHYRTTKVIPYRKNIFWKDFSTATTLSVLQNTY